MMKLKTKIKRNMTKAAATALIWAFLTVGLAGCLTNAKSAKQVLEEAGYTDIQITGYSMFLCKQDDMFSTGFVATSPSKKRVEGAVCKAGFYMGNTIRFK